MSHGGVERQRARDDSTRFGQTLQPMSVRTSPRWRMPQCSRSGLGWAYGSYPRRCRKCGHHIYEYRDTRVHAALFTPCLLTTTASATLHSGL
jgi:hypothetical protein